MTSFSNLQTDSDSLHKDSKIQNLPESRNDDPKDRQEEDRAFLLNLLENKMDLDMGAIEIRKVVRLGKREAGQTKRRPIRFTANQFDHKRQILKANNLLR